jgi:hypothetical protein
MSGNEAPLYTASKTLCAKKDENEAFGSHLGFFGRVFNENGKIIKRYRGLLTKKEADIFAQQHARFINNLREVGTAVPETEIRFIPVNGKFRVEIVQEPFAPQELAGEIVKSGDKSQVLYVARGIINDALRFIRSPQMGKMGFHPTVKNYAIRSGTFYMFDTFPPFQDRKTTEELMRRHAPSRAFKILMTLFPSLLHESADEYYDAVPMLHLIYAATSRLRPEFEADVRALILEMCKPEEILMNNLRIKIDRDGYKHKSRLSVFIFETLRAVFPKK